MTGDDESPARTRSVDRDFGHLTSGWAVEFNLAGVACRTLTMETMGEATAVKGVIEKKDGPQSVEVVKVE